MSKRSLSELEEVFTTPTPPPTLPTLPLSSSSSTLINPSAFLSNPANLQYNNTPPTTTSSSDTFKKLKNELNLLFPGNNAVVHPNVVQYNDLCQLDDKTCAAFVDTLRLHGFHRVIKMPSDFVNTCNNLYSSAKIFLTGGDEHFKRSSFPERDTETGYKIFKDRESISYKKGYPCASESARDLTVKLDTYFADATRISTTIFEAVVKGLGGNVELARKILPDITTDGISSSIARVLNYNDTPIHTVTCAPHSDVGLITIIPANLPGLEVYSLCGNCGVGWENTNKAMDQTDIIVLCGDTLNELANGTLAPGLHRVVSHERTELMNSLFSAFSPQSTTPTPTPPPTTAKGRGRGKKADNNKKNNNNTAIVAAEPAAKIGRISLPFLLRAKGDIKLDGALVGLQSGVKKDKVICQYVDEERRRKGAVGLY